MIGAGRWRPAAPAWPWTVGLVVAVAASVSGCAPRTLAEAVDRPVVPSDVAVWTRPAEQIVWVQRRYVGDLPLPAEAVRQDWTLLEHHPRFGPVVELRTTIDPTGDPREIVQIANYGPQGFVLAAEQVPGGELAMWDPPLVLFAPGARIGSSWSGEHRLGDGPAVQRTCEVHEDTLCAGGLVVVCDRRSGEGLVLLTRDHYCPGTAWSGYESLVQRPDQPTVRTWTESVERDGVPLDVRDDDD